MYQEFIYCMYHNKSSYDSPSPPFRSVVKQYHNSILHINNHELTIILPNMLSNKKIEFIMYY